MKITWNNKKAGTSGGHCLDDIMDNIKVNDIYISELGIVYICIDVSKKEDGKFGGFVHILETKSNGTSHMGRKPVEYIKWNGYWEKR